MPETRRNRPLFELAPQLYKYVSPLDLAELPTGVRDEASLAQSWGLKSLHIKCDDQTSSIYGGSKLRNLEYFLGHARSLGIPGIVTMGPYGSHQALATAVYGERLGFKTRAVLTPQPEVRESALNEKMLSRFGMEVYRCKGFLNVPAAYLRARYKKLAGERPYWIPPGSAHPFGVLGVVEGALEVAASIRAGELEMPDDVVVATGTCATAAGLYLGFAIAGLPVRVVAVRVVPMFVSGERKLRKMAKQTLDILQSGGLQVSPKWGELLWIDSHAAPGYGLANPEALAVMEEVKRHGSFRTDVTYTGKTLALFRTSTLAERRVLFWNTYSARDPDLPPIRDDSSIDRAAEQSVITETKEVGI